MGALGATYGLLQLPKMPELKNRDLTDFPEIENLNLNAIPYKDKARESVRLKKLEEFKKTGKIMYKSSNYVTFSRLTGGGLCRSSKGKERIFLRRCSY